MFEKQTFLSEIGNIGEETRTGLDLKPYSVPVGFISLASLQTEKGNRLQMVGVNDMESCVELRYFNNFSQHVLEKGKIQLMDVIS